MDNQNAQIQELTQVMSMMIDENEDINHDFILDKQNKEKKKNVNTQNTQNSLHSNNSETAYGKAKLKAGISSRSLCKELGIRHIWTRVLSIYGPFDGPNTLITSTIRKIINGERPALTAGEQVWDYLYSKDAAKALLMLGEFGLLF